MAVAAPKLDDTWDVRSADRVRTDPHDQLVVRALSCGGLVTATRAVKLVHYRAYPPTIAGRLAELQRYQANCCPPERAPLG